MNLVLPRTFLFIIASRPEGTMFQFTGSAWIQYSRAVELVLAASTVLASAPLPRFASAAATFGGTGTPAASFGTSAPLSRKTLCPARVQRKRPPAPARKSRRSTGSGLICA